MMALTDFDEMRDYYRPRALTTREREVLLAASRDFDSFGIARLLDISPRTVTTHKGSILRKLAVHSMAGAVAAGLREGLIR